LDLMLENDGSGMLYFPFLNYAQGSLDPCLDMLKSDASLPGLSDGGAHVGMICDGSFPTTMLTHWTRDRTRGDKLPLEYIVHKQTMATAHWVGLQDRGVLAAGYRADINIIDHDKLTLHAPTVNYDLPANGRRLMQHASGYVATLVAGQVIYRDGKPTGARPGRLVRGAKAAPDMQIAAQ
jgi:N-acyl-D-aspartate/D-glutamate deacylase